MAREEKLSAAQQKLQALLRNKDLAKVVGSTFAEVLVESMDAKREAEHWKAAFETVRDEIKQLAAIILRQQHLERIVVTRAELQEIPRNLELYCGTPEPGVRIYELRQRAPNVRRAVHDSLLELPPGTRPS